MAIVGFVFGTAAGALLAHERAKRTSGHTDVTDSATPTNPSSWFASSHGQACPALWQWTGAFVEAYRASLTQAPWPSERATLIKLMPNSDAAYRRLRQYAAPTAKKELDYLISYEKNVVALMNQSSSKGAYSSAIRAAPAYRRLITDVSGLYFNARTCGSAPSAGHE